MHTAGHGIASIDQQGKRTAPEELLQDDRGEFGEFNRILSYYYSL